MHRILKRINYEPWEMDENAEFNGTAKETITTNLLGPWSACAYDNFEDCGKCLKRLGVPDGI